MKNILVKCLMLAGFIVLVVILSNLVMPKYQTELIEGSMIREYYDSEKNHELMFFGDCEVYTAYSPVEIFEKAGISSYVRGSSQQLIWMTYDLIEETLRYEKPKVIVLSVNAMRYDENVSDAYLHLTTDYMPFSKQKIQMILSSKIDENILDYTIPLVRYHDRILKLTEEDFKYYFTKETISYNGFLINQDVKAMGGLPAKKPLAEKDFSANCYHYLDKIVNLCKDNDIELVLVKTPSQYPYWYQEYDESMINYSKEHNIEFINMLNYVDDIGLDFSVDTYDAGLHLNYSGATKLTDYLIKIISEKFDFTDYRLDKEVNDYYQKLSKKYYQEIRGEN